MIGALSLIPAVIALVVVAEEKATALCTPLIEQ